MIRHTRPPTLQEELTALRSMLLNAERRTNDAMIKLRALKNVVDDLYAKVCNDIALFREMRTRADGAQAAAAKMAADKAEEDSKARNARFAG